MASTKKQGEAAGNERVTGLPFAINDQYVKDISFENINYMIRYQEAPAQPQVTVNVETNVAKIDKTYYEVVMKVSIRSFVEKTDIFVLEIEYGALVGVDSSLQQDVVETVLFVHCPFLMFPFVRRIVSDTVSSGGYPPLLIEPIDFASLYVERKQATQKQETDGEDRGVAAEDSDS
jgi:preprotein translocase subunit SecB